MTDTERASQLENIVDVLAPGTRLSDQLPVFSAAFRRDAQRPIPLAILPRDAINTLARVHRGELRHQPPTTYGLMRQTFDRVLEDFIKEFER